MEFGFQGFIKLVENFELAWKTVFLNVSSVPSEHFVRILQIIFINGIISSNAKMRPNSVVFKMKSSQKPVYLYLFDVCFG